MDKSILHLASLLCKKVLTTYNYGVIPIVSNHPKMIAFNKIVYEALVRLSKTSKSIDELGERLTNHMLFSYYGLPVNVLKNMFSYNNALFMAKNILMNAVEVTISRNM